VLLVTQQEAQEWFDSNPGAEKEDYVDKAKELETVYVSARQKAAAEGAATGAGDAGAEGSAEEEPKVEEVD
jgi:hypothetical protein